MNAKSDAQDFRRLFCLLKIIIMAKIILIDGVINVKESYEEIRLFIANKSEWLELVDINNELKTIEKVTGIAQDYRILINSRNIQAIKP